MSTTRLTDPWTCASTINVTVNCATTQVVVVVELDRVRDQRDAAEPDPASDHYDDRSQDCEINEATLRRWARRYGADTVPVTGRAWARWRAVRREVQRDLEARHRERVRLRQRVHRPSPARRRARAARRVARAAKSGTDDGDGGEGDEGGAL